MARSHMLVALGPNGVTVEIPEDADPMLETPRERAARLRREYHRAQAEVTRAMVKAESLWSAMLAAEDDELRAEEG